MLDSRNAFVTPSFLRSVWNTEYEAFKDTPAETALIERLRRWAARNNLHETGAEPAFIAEFFHATWDYVQTGQANSTDGYTLRPQFPVRGAGAKGGVGKADLALGYFNAKGAVPQVLCEFKSIKSALDADQKRKDNTRSPVRQALDYLSHARRGMIGSEPQVPTWAIVSDMNEFRLYWYDRGDRQHVGFVIQPRTLFDGPGLLADTEAARFDRFLFARLFHRQTLLTRGGRPELLRLIHERRFRDRAIEEAFYAEYRALRDDLYTQLLVRNGEGTPRFPGTRGRLVRLAQKILDRLLFVFFCEDMGQQLAFPPKLLQEYLVSRANDPYFDPAGTTIWHELLSLFRAMNDGTAFGARVIHRFNGGLFAPDPVLEALDVPNALFCQPGQGQNEPSIAAHPRTVLYLCATYNYAADLGEGGTRDERRSLGLYTLGRIFEQSITELEILEAEADERPSVNKASQRKRDGVYYTPEWVVDRVVDGTLGPAFRAMRNAVGWPGEGEDLPTAAIIDAYLERLRAFTVLDPACGSGAFLITALHYLLEEWRRTLNTRAEVAGRAENEEDGAALIARLLRDNIFGVDINPASVEIAQLALWLHTAQADQPLSSLDQTVVPGNTLVTPDFYRGVQTELLDDEARERVAAFDWRVAFPAVAARGGFDAVVGNPPYVKLQNFRKAYPDVAEYLVHGRPGMAKPFKSTQTGNFDLYLPFIEQGLTMLNGTGRLGYIAPSSWTVNDYGAALRALVAGRRQLDRWLDFKSHQVFEEATTYTALQFFSKAPTEAICVAQAPRGVVPPDPWADTGHRLAWGREGFGDRWLLLTGGERALVDRLSATCRRLDDAAHSTAIFTGLQTSADAIYHLKRVSPGRYRCKAAADVPPVDVDIEDAIMRPLVSGTEAKRYQQPQTDTWLLFPYVLENGQVRLIPPATMARDYPKAWSYLQSHAPALRRREAKRSRQGVEERPFDDEAWYRFGRHQGLDNQRLPKLIVAQTVPSLRVCFDNTGEFAPNNVRVNGILPAEGVDPLFLLGVLNAPVADWVFRRIAKPKDGGWFEANKQFIAPLPIPPATDAERAAVATAARELQQLHTLRRNLLAPIARRLGTVMSRLRPDTWLFPGLTPLHAREADAPPGLDAAARRAWIRNAYETDLAARQEVLGASLRPGVTLDADLVDGELRFLIDGAPIVDRVFVALSEGPFLLAQWKLLASTLAVSERTDGKALSKALRKLASPENPPVVEQILALVGELQACEVSISRMERQLNEIIFGLYQLTKPERALIEGL